jgi:ketosteroid isomerase-like protein
VIQPRAAIVGIIALLFVSFAGSVSGGVAAQSSSTPELSAADHDLVAASNRWFDALLRGDAETLRTLEADDFVVVQQTPRGLLVMDRAVQLRNLRTDGAGPRLHRELNSVRIRRYGNVAVLTARAVLQRIPDGARTEAVVSEVWVNQNGQWRVAHFVPVDVPTLPAPPEKRGN